MSNRNRGSQFLNGDDENDGRNSSDDSTDNDENSLAPSRKRSDNNQSTKRNQRPSIVVDATTTSNRSASRPRTETNRSEKLSHPRAPDAVKAAVIRRASSRSKNRPDDGPSTTIPKVSSRSSTSTGTTGTAIRTSSQLRGKQRVTRPSISSSTSMDQRSSSSTARPKSVQRNHSTPELSPLQNKRPSSVQRPTTRSSPTKIRSTTTAPSGNSCNRPRSVQRPRSMGSDVNSPSNNVNDRPKSARRSRPSLDTHHSKSMSAIHETDTTATPKQYRSGKRPDRTNKSSTTTNSNTTTLKDDEIPNRSHRHSEQPSTRPSSAMDPVERRSRSRLKGIDESINSPSKRSPEQRKNNGERDMRKKSSIMRGNEDAAAEADRSKRMELRKSKSSPDIDIVRGERIDKQRLRPLPESTSKSSSCESKKKPQQKESRSDGKRTLVRKPSMQEMEVPALTPSHAKYDQKKDVDRPSDGENDISTRPPNVASKQQQQQPPSRNHQRTLVRKPSMQDVLQTTNQNREMDASPSDSNNDNPKRPKEEIMRHPTRTLLRKPSIERDEQDVTESSNDDSDSDDSGSITNSSGASTVIQFDPTIGGGVVHVDPNEMKSPDDENDDCLSMASFHDKACSVSYDMENSWRAPVLSFQDSDGEELAEKPQARRHNLSSKMCLSLLKTPTSCGDSVHTKSSESNGSSSFGRPQFYAPQHSKPINTSLFTDPFTSHTEKIQDVRDLNSATGERKEKKYSKAVKQSMKKTKTKMKDVELVDINDETSQLSSQSSHSKSRVKNDALQNSNHSILMPPSDDSSSIDSDDSDDHDRRMLGNVFKPTVLGVNNSATAYESEMEKETKSTKPSKGGIGKYFFGRRDKGSKKKQHAVDESDISDSEYSCSSEVSSTSRRSGVFGGRRFSRVHQNHTLLGDDDDDNDAVPF